METPTYQIKTDRNGRKEIVWRNTSTDKPTLQEIIEVAEKEFLNVPFNRLGLLAGIMSLTLKEGHSIL